jgi:predicted helicase
VRAFQQSNLSNKELCDQVGITAKAAWNVTKSRKQLSDINNLRDYIVSFLHRPFDSKYLFYERSLVWSMAWPVNRNLMVKGNLALTVSRQLSAPPWRHVFCSNTIVELCYITNKTKEGNHVFPLYLLPDEKGGQISLTGHDSRELNFNPDFIREFSASLRVGIDTYLGLPKGLTPEDIFNYIYAVFHSPGYRSRYEEFLKIDFPRLPLTDDLKIFRALAKLGGELIALHLLESPKLKKTATKFIGKNPVVSKVGWTPDDGGTVWLDGKGTAKNFQPGTTGFCSVPEEVWNYRIGAYQVCEKWLKDRGPHKGNPGRTLTNDDIAHYNKIVIALTETIRIMAEIDVVIESHGGWPGAFVTDSGGVKETDSEVTYPDSDREQAQLDMVVEPKDG